MSTDLTWPAVWRRRRGTAVVLLVLMGLAVAAAVDAALRGDGLRDGRMLIMVGFATAIAAIGVTIGMQHLMPRRVSAAAVRTSRVDESPVPGLAIPNRRGLAVARAVAAAGVLVIGVVLLMAGVIGVAREMSGAVAALVLGAIVVVGAAGPLVPVVKGRGGGGALILTPDGVLHRSQDGDVAASWWAVVDVVPVSAVPAGIAIVCRPGPPAPATVGAPVDADRPQSRRARWTRAWLDPTARFRPDVVVVGMDLAVDPVLALRLVELYVRRPDLRDELGTPLAVARAHAMTEG